MLFLSSTKLAAFAQSESELTTPSVESGGTVRGTSAMALKRVCVSREVIALFAIFPRAGNFGDTASALRACQASSKEY